MTPEQSNLDASQDGGPAFPETISTSGDGRETAYLSSSSTYIASRGGMSLRDWFAGQAIHKVMSEMKDADYHNAARKAYLLADAMLKARSK